MEKRYKIALSYAHRDEAIAEILKSELENIFADKFFADNLRPEELSDASVFKQRLRKIFYESQYAVILYSENYIKGTFTPIEKEAILETEKHIGFSHMFIININDLDIKKAFIYEHTYMGLNVKSLGDKGWEVDSDVINSIHEIAHKQIKNRIRDQSMMENQKGEYLIKVQTTSGASNSMEWDFNYDWNVLGKAFVDPGSRVVKEGCEWDELWDYIQSDFGYLSKNLPPDIKRKIHLDCQLSIAFLLGQEYGDLGQKSGNRNLELSSSNAAGGIFPLEPKIHYDLEGLDFCIEYEENDADSKDVIYIIAIKIRNTEVTFPTVKNFLKDQGQKYRRIYLFQKEMKMEDTTTLENMAEYIRKKMALCGGECGSGYNIHIFPDTAAPFMFLLGARTIISGGIRLYEFKKEQNTYEVSFVRRKAGNIQLCQARREYPEKERWYSFLLA